MLSMNNKRFFLCIVDDFSKYIWIFPLSQKSEVYATFLHFKILVENYFNSKIKSVQSDNGGEFRPLQSRLPLLGISYRLSCPHTHHGILLKLDSHFLLLPMFLSTYGMKLLTQPHIL
jgi:hypothetical protein